MNVDESKLRIYNLALVKLGVRKAMDAVDDDRPEADAFNAIWEQILNEVLELGEWRCARRRATLERDTDSVEDATQAEPVVITATAHTFQNGDLVRFTDVGGMTELNGNTYMVKNKAADTFELWDENGTVKLDGSGFGAYTSGGTIWRIPNWGYSYMFRLPDDCIKPIKTAVDIGGWVIEYNFLLTDYEDDELEILYIFYLSDPTYFSPLLADAVATRLAAVYTPERQKKKDLGDEFSALLQLARGEDSRWRSSPDQPSQLITEV